MPIVLTRKSGRSLMSCMVDVVAGVHAETRKTGLSELKSKPWC